MNTSKTNIIYARLSVDDGEDKISNSIQNQFALLTDYAERNGFTPYLALQDDGYSGSNFDRPGWQELIARVEAGEVGTLLLKDASRMGRSYLQCGLYREMFASKGVRLICVNDGTDTLFGDDDFTPFREIMAEWYVRDCSRKVKSAIQTKGKAGKPTSNMPPYGFVKDPDDKNAWRVDPEAAEVVRRIFDLTINGNGPYEICRILHDEKVERPSYYLAKRGHPGSKKGLDTDTPYSWKGNVISGILSKPEYAGHTVNFRTVKTSYKAKHSKPAPQENWLIFPNTHEPIVSQETWDLAQKCREVVRRTDTTGEANPLTGLLYCAQCGSRMYNNRSNGREQYSCASNHLSRQRFENKCTGHYVSTAAVRAVVLESIQKTTAYVREHEQEFAEKLREASALRQGETVKTHRKQISKNERRIAELDGLFESVYEDKVKGVLTEERFAQMSAKYEREQEELRGQNAALKAEVDAFINDGEKADKFIEIVRRYTRIDELTAPILHEFIERVEIHEGVWSEQNEHDTRRGTRSQQIDVYLNYVGKFDLPDERTAEQIEAERAAEEKLAARRAHKREYQRRRTEAKRAAESIAATA